MLKNGLFLISLGFISIMYSINTITASYQWGKVGVAIILIISGAFLFNKGRIKERKEKEEA